MHVLITGAAGMIGRKLAQRLAGDGALNGQRIGKVTLLDVVSPAQVLNFAGQMEIVAADLSEPGKAARAVEARPDTIFHLAGVVSGEAELARAARLDALRPAHDDACPQWIRGGANARGNTVAGDAP